MCSHLEQFLTHLHLIQMNLSNNTGLKSRVNLKNSIKRFLGAIGGVCHTPQLKERKGGSKTSPKEGAKVTGTKHLLRVIFSSWFYFQNSLGYCLQEPKNDSGTFLF